jgi:beta-glucosidase
VPLPDDFLWGTAASSTQAEGAAPRADWWAWEREGHAPLSGNGNGFGTGFADDFRLLAEHGLTHHRLSIEWARIEPWVGKHDKDEIDRYRDMLRAARDAGIAVWVCLHHFTLPGWFSDDMGGFLDDKGLSYYWPRHVDFVAETFGDLVAGWKPMNEPVAYAGAAYLLGIHPPGKTDPADFFAALEATHLANHAAWQLLSSGDAPVATVHNLSPLYPADDSDPTRRMLGTYDDVVWTSWSRMLREGVLQLPGRAPIEREDFADSFDLIGFSYYSAQTVDAAGVTGPYPAAARVGPLGYAPWSEGLAVTLRRLADELPGRDLLVCEHGVGTEDDDWREEVLRSSLELIEDAVDDGLPVKGFFHWTAVDNYEWSHGYDVPFGLFDRDRDPKPASAALMKRYATRRNTETT